MIEIKIFGDDTDFEKRFAECEAYYRMTIISVRNLYDEGVDKVSKALRRLIGELVQVELSGKKVILGKVIDVGVDLIVLSRGQEYVYIPLLHMKNIKVMDNDEIEMNFDSGEGIVGIVLDEHFSLRKALINAKGMFLELYVTGNEPIHGYITSVLNNYFVFYSPIYKTMYIPLNHFKWIVPYQNNKRPYGLNEQEFPVRPTSMPVARSFEVQIEKLKDKLVIFNLGENNTTIGKINDIVDNVIELETVKETKIYLNMQHIKTVHTV